MKSFAHSSLGILMIIMLVFAFTIAGCEPYQSLTFENRAATPVNVTIAKVPLDYTENLSGTWDDPNLILKPGELKKTVTDVPDNRRGGIRSKYIVLAVTETNAVVFYKIYTWDELREMEWTVVIEEKQ